MQLKEVSENVWALVGIRWTDFVNQNINNQVRFIHFVEEGEDTFYVTTYNEMGLENHGYEQTSDTYWRCLLQLRAFQKDIVSSFQVISELYMLCLFKHFNFYETGSAVAISEQIY